MQGLKGLIRGAFVFSLMAMVVTSIATIATAIPFLDATPGSLEQLYYQSRLAPWGIGFAVSLGVLLLTGVLITITTAKKQNKF